MNFTPAQKLTLKNCLQEISGSLTRVEAERDHIKDIVGRISEEFQMNKRTIRRLAKVFHKRNIEEENAAAQELSDTYDAIVKP
jgi:uncharacterized protein YukE